MTRAQAGAARDPDPGLPLGSVPSRTAQVPEEWLVSITGSEGPQLQGHCPPFPQSSLLLRLGNGNCREPCRVRLRLVSEAAKLGSEDLD